MALSMILVTTPICCTTTKKQHIYFGAFLSNLYKDELCFKAAIDTAVQLVNEDDALLKGFHLKIKYFDNFVSIFQYSHLGKGLLIFILEQLRQAIVDIQRDQEFYFVNNPCARF